MHASHGGEVVLSTPAERTRGCPSETWALDGQRKTGVHATLAGIHDRSLMPWPVHDFGLCLLSAAGTSRVAGSRQRYERERAPFPDRTGDGNDRCPPDLFANGPALRRAHEPGDHADVLPAGQGR